MAKIIKIICLISILSIVVGLSGAELDYMSIKYKSLRNIKLVLKNDPLLVNICDGLGRTPLHLASAEGRLALVNLFIKAGADVNDIDSLNGYTPLHYACFHGYVHIARFLLARGAKVNSVDKMNNTPLHFAAGNGNLELCDLLILHGANTSLVNTYGCTPLFNSMLLGKDYQNFPYAQKGLKNYIEQAKILSKPSWLMNLQNCKGVTPLDNLKKSGLAKRKVNKILNEISKFIQTR